MTITSSAAARQPFSTGEAGPEEAAQSVLMITPAFPPVVGAGVFRTLRFVRYLPEFSWRPLVLSLDVDRTDDPSVMDHIPADLFVRRVALQGTTAVSRRPPQPEGTSCPAQADLSFAARLKRTAPYQIVRNGWKLFTETPDKNVRWNARALPTALQIIDSQRPAAIYTSGPPHSVHLLGRKLKRLTGLPWLADFRDPWARRPWGNKPENPWGQRLYPWLESRCVHSADSVILNTDSMTADFRAAYPHLPPNRFVTITNSCDPQLAETVAALLSRQPARDHHLPIRLCHPGSLYRERDPRPLIQAIATLRQEGLNVEFEQIGHCDPRFDLQHVIASHQLQQCVRIQPPVPHAQVLEHMAAADILVLLQPRTSIQIPGKLFEMILFNKPILALCHDGATADLIREHKLGRIADPDSPQHIGRAVTVLAESLLINNNHRSRQQDSQQTFDARKLTMVLAQVLQQAAFAHTE